MPKAKSLLPPEKPYLVDPNHYAVVENDHVPEFFDHPYDVIMYANQLIDQGHHPVILRIKPHPASDDAKITFPVDDHAIHELRQLKHQINDISYDSRAFFADYLEHPQKYQSDEIKDQLRHANTEHFTPNQIKILMLIDTLGGFIVMAIKNTTKLPTSLLAGSNLTLFIIFLGLSLWLGISNWKQWRQKHHPKK